jgi:MFS family permease
VADRWLSAWGLASVAFGGASLIIPLYVVELGGDAFALGLLFASASFVGVPGALVFGNLADRTGKRRVFVLAAMAITAVTMAVVPLLDTLGPVVVANAVLWFGFAAATPVLTLLAIAGEPESRWSGLIGRLNRFQGIGWALGLALGTAVVAGGGAIAAPLVAQRAFFVACAASAGLGLVLGGRTLPPDPAPEEVPSPRRLRRLVRMSARFNVRGAASPFTPGRIDVRQLHPRRFVDRFTTGLATYFLAVFLAFTGFGVFFAPLPAYLAGLGYGSGAIFGLYLVLNAGAAVCYGRAAWLADAYDATRVHVAGLVVRGVAFPTTAAVGGVLGGTLLGSGVLAALFGVVGLTWAVIAVTAATLVTRLSPPVIRGEALGVYGSLVAVGGGAGGLFGGWLAGFGYAVAFGTAGVLAVAGAAVVLAVARHTRAREPTGGTETP